MSQKYDASAVLSNHAPRLITNDLYLAAFLLCQGCEWCGLVRNDRRRLSFVFRGENVHQLREEYESGTVRLNVRAYRDTLLSVRRKMDAAADAKAMAAKEQRSVAYGPDTGSGVGAAQA